MSNTAFSHKTASRPDRMIQDYHETASLFGLHRWDPRLKFALLILAVGLNVVIARTWLSLLLLGISLGLVIQSRIPVRLLALFFLAPAWATLVVFMGFSVGFGITPVWSAGPLTVYREGMLQGAAAAARVVSDMSWMAVVFLTTPITRLLETLRWYRVPGVLVDTIALAHRYAFLLMEEFQSMREASRMRGGYRGYRRHLRSLALILSQVILRSYDRAGRIQTAMSARGAAAEGSCHMTVRKGPLSDRTESCPNRCDVTPHIQDRFAPVLSCSHLCYARSGNRVLSDLSFAVGQGDVVALCGPNGAGKTTLLHLCAGILTPAAGEIDLCGRRLDRKNRNSAFHFAGLLFQDPNDQLFCTHVREDVAYGPVNLGLDQAEVNRLVDTAMELMEIGHLANRPIHRLSHGEMKRVGLAGLIAMRPPLILLDEPTASLDPASTLHLVGLIRHLNSHHGYTFVIVTHDINLAALLAKRIIVLNHGKIVADGSPRKILTDEALLKDSRLEPPILTRLFQEVLGDAYPEDRIPVTLEEAVCMLKDLAARRRDCA